MSGLTKSNIPYLTHNWSVVTGCTKCSPACENCWSFAQHERFHPGEPWTVRTHEDKLDAVIRRKKPAVIGVAFTSDLFHPDVLDTFIDQVFAVMAMCPHHVFVVLTKRPERMLEFVSSYHNRVYGHGAVITVPECVYGKFDRQAYMDQFKPPYPHVMFGFTGWDHESVKAAGPYMKELYALGWSIWWSFEPALGSVTPPSGLLRRLSWVVAGCEQLPGGKAGRVGDSHVIEVNEWMLGVSMDCHESGIPCYVKQVANGRVVHLTPEDENLPELLRGRL